MRPTPVLSAAAILAGLLAAPAAPASGEDSAPYLVRDIETAGVPAPGPDCPAVGPPCPEIYGSVPSQLTRFGDRLAFVAFDGDHGVEPWVSDGTEKGTRRLADLAPGEQGSDPCLLGAVNGRLLLGARLDTGRSLRLLTTDGETIEPLHRTSAVCSPLAQDGPLRPAVGGRLVYELEERIQAGRHTRLWVTDGVETEPIARLCPFEGAPFPDRPCSARVERYAVLGDDLYLAVSFELPPTSDGSPATALGRLYRLPAGAGELEVVAETCAGQPHFGDFTAVDGVVYMTDGCLAASPERFGLYRIDAEGVEVLHEPISLRLHSPAAAGGFVYYVAETFEIIELWRTDGTPEGTEWVVGEWGAPAGSPHPFGNRVVFDYRVGLHALLPDGTRLNLQASADGARLTPVDAGLAFAARREEAGLEPWITDGTVEGTRALGDVAPGPEWSYPAGFAQVGGLLLFSAETEELGRELWAVRVADEETPPEPPPNPPFATWIESPAFPGFRFQVRIGHGSASAAEGAEVLGCQDDTVCVSGAVPGRPEVYLRVLGPRPNGFLWPTVIRFTPSRVEVWVEQESTGQVNYYELPPVEAGQENLSGRQDRRGFLP